MGEISKSGLRRGRGGNTSPSLLYKIEETPNPQGGYAGSVKTVENRCGYSAQSAV